MKRAIVAILIAALVGLLAWQIVVRVGDSAEGIVKKVGGPGGGATPVAVVDIARATVRDLQLFTGTLVPRNQSVVAPKIAGRLERLTVDIGDRVSKGQLIALLDDDEYARQVEMAAAELEVAEANVEESLSTQALLARELERVRTLREKQIASVADLDTAEAQSRAASAKYRVAKAQVDQRKAALRAAEIRRSYTRIVAEWSDGAQERVVGERFVNQSDMLRANDPIITLLDVSKVTAVVGVTERNYARMHIGQTVQLRTDAYPDREFEGKVVRIAPQVREQSREGRVEIEIDNNDGLLVPGLFVRAEVEFERQDEAIVVPSESIVRRGEQRGVFVINADKSTARFVAVKMGIVERNVTQIVEPHDLSGQVVVLGQHLLEDGGKILLPQAAAGERGSGKAGGKGSEAVGVKSSAVSTEGEAR